MRCLAFLAALLLAACATPAPAGRLAEVTVYDRTAGGVLPVHWHEGRAWIAGRPGNEYQVVVRSRRSEDLLAVVSVDGVNVITGETASPGQSGYVLSPWRALEIRGWRKSLERTAAFYFTALPDSYAARTGRPDEVGAIGVALFQRRRPEPPAEIAPLAQESPAPRASRREEAGRADREDRLGTGHGRSEASPARTTHFERASAHPAETLVLYYDSHRNLVARGIIPAPVAPRPLPRPFPGFAPDPPA